MCCVSKHSVDLGMLSWLFLKEGFFFSLLRETICPRFYTSSTHDLCFWLHRTAHWVVRFSRGIWLFEGCLTRSCQTELPTGRLTSHFGSECRWKLRHSVFCTDSPAEGPLDNCSAPQMTGFRCAGSNHTEKQSRQRGVCSASTAVLPQCRDGSIGLHCSYRWEQKTSEWELQQQKNVTGSLPVQT